MTEPKSKQNLGAGCTGLPDQILWIEPGVSAHSRLMVCPLRVGEIQPIDRLDQVFRNAIDALRHPHIRRSKQSEARIRRK